MKPSGFLIFLILLGFCTLIIWPLYQQPIEKDLTRKVNKLYVNQVHNTPDIHFDRLHLQINSGDITPHFYQKLGRIAGAYIPPYSPSPPPEPAPPEKPTLTQLPEPGPALDPSEIESSKQTTSLVLTRLPSIVTMNGVLPDPATRDTIISALKEYTPGATLVDHTEIAPNPAPAWWHQHPAKFLPRFLKDTHGHAYLNYTSERFKIIGKVSNPDSLAQIQAEIARFPTSISRDVKLSFLAPPKKKPTSVNPAPTNKQPARALVVETDDSLPNTFSTIHFSFGGGGSAWLHPKFDKKFKQLTALINGHPDETQKFTIVSYGTSNRELSELRAKAVRKKLIAMDIPEDRLLIAHLPRKQGEKRRVQLKLSSTEEIEAEKLVAQEKIARLEAEKKKAEEKKAAEEKAAAEKAAAEEAARLAELALPPVPAPLQEITFSFGGSGSAWLHPNTTPRIKKLATFISEYPEASQKFTVASYGTTKSELSQLRAIAVRDKLISLGVPADRLLIGDFGKRKNQKRRVQLNLATAEDLATFPAPEKEEPGEPEEASQNETTPDNTTPPTEQKPEPQPLKPAEPKPAPLTPSQQLKKFPITFSGETSSWIHSSYFPQLRKMSGIIKKLPEKNQAIIIGSYGCPNLEISNQRAQATREKLIANGINPERLKIEHFDIKPQETSRIELSLGAIPEIPKAQIVTPEDELEETITPPTPAEEPLLEQQ